MTPRGPPRCKSPIFSTCKGKQRKLITKLSLLVRHFSCTWMMSAAK